MAAQDNCTQSCKIYTWFVALKIRKKQCKLCCLAEADCTERYSGLNIILLASKIFTLWIHIGEIKRTFIRIYKISKRKKRG